MVELPTDELIKGDMLTTDGFESELISLQFFKHVHNRLVMLSCFIHHHATIEHWSQIRIEHRIGINFFHTLSIGDVGLEVKSCLQTVILQSEAHGLYTPAYPLTFSR